MLHAATEINWIAVVLATIASSVLGGLWFTVLFGRAYAVALGRESEPPAKPAPLFIIGPMACQLATTITSALLMRALGIASLVDALLLALVTGLGYLVATMANTAINPNFPRPFLYSAISGPFFALSNTGAILILLAMG